MMRAIIKHEDFPAVVGFAILTAVPMAILVALTSLS